MNKRGFGVLEIIAIIVLVAAGFTLISNDVVNLSPKSADSITADSDDSERALGLVPSLTIFSPEDGSTIKSSSVLLNVTTNTNTMCYYGLSMFGPGYGGGSASRLMATTGEKSHFQLIENLTNTVINPPNLREYYRVDVNCSNRWGSDRESSSFFVDIPPPNQYNLFTSSNGINLNESLSSTRNVITETNFPLLADGSFNGNIMVRHATSIRLNSPSNEDNRFIYGKHPTSENDPVFAFKLGTTTGDNIYNITTHFSNYINFAHPDSKGKNITLLGRNFTIGQRTNSTVLFLEGDKNLILQDKKSILDYTSTADPRTIEGTNVVFNDSISHLAKLTIQISAPDTDSDALIERDEFIDPVFGTFKLDFRTTNVPEYSDGRENIMLEPEGNDKMSFYIEDSLGVTDFIWYQASQNLSKLVNQNGNKYHIKEMSEIKKADYAVVGNENEGYLLELIRLENSSSGFSNDRITFRNVFDEVQRWTANISEEGFGNLIIGNKWYNLTYKDDPTIIGDEFARLNYPDSLGEDLIIYPTKQTWHGADIAFYEPLVINLNNFYGSLGRDVTALLISNGAGYTSVPVEILPNGLLKINNNLVDPSSSAVVNTGKVSYNFTWHDSNQTKVYLQDFNGTNIEDPALVLFEDNNENLIVEIEGDGINNKVGVKDIQSSGMSWGFYELESDPDLSKKVDLWGTIMKLDSTDPDQKSLQISYNFAKLRAEVYVVEVV